MIDAAFDLGFGSVDGFTRAFTREFGTRPSAYAAEPVPIPLFVPYGAKFRALRKEQTMMKHTSNIFIQVIHKPERFKKPNTSTYVQGVEVTEDYTGPVPEGFDVIGLPAADYLMFQGEPFAEEDYCDAISAVRRAMNGYDPAVIGYAWDDSVPRIQLKPRGNRGYIELRAIK